MTTEPQGIATPGEQRTRRKLIEKLSVKLDELKDVSNNDIRRLTEHLTRVLAVARQLDRYPIEVGIPDLEDVLKYEHCASEALRRYAIMGMPVQLPISDALQKAVRAHLMTCSVCRVRVRAFKREAENSLVCGQAVVKSPPGRAEHTLLSETNLVGSSALTRSELDPLRRFGRRGNEAPEESA